MKILLFEKDPTLGEAVSSGLQKAGFDVTWVREYVEAIRDLNGQEFGVDLVEITDANTRGLELINEIFKNGEKPLCVSLYSQQNTENGFEASQLGSQRIFDIQHGKIQALSEIIAKYIVRISMPQIYPHSLPAFLKSINDLRGLINHNKPVLITGEPGSGKSYLAEHVRNEETQKSFQVEEIDCGSLIGEEGEAKLLGVARNANGTVKKERVGLLDKANKKGLLYLEHIHKLPPVLQTALVKLIENGKYTPVGGLESKDFTAHIVASCDDIKLLQENDFNSRLYELLGYNVVKLPSLKDSQADIIPTAEQIIHEYCTKQHLKDEPKLDESAMIKIYTHCWPGNYRELKCCIESAVSRCSNNVITEHDLNIIETEEEAPLPSDEKAMLIFYLKRYNGKKSEVAKAINKSRPTLDSLLIKNGLDAKDYKPKTKPKSKRKKDENNRKDSGRDKQ